MFWCKCMNMNFKCHRNVKHWLWWFFTNSYILGVNLLIGTDNGLMLLDRSGQGKGLFDLYFVIWIFIENVFTTLFQNMNFIIRKCISTMCTKVVFTFWGTNLSYYAHSYRFWWSFWHKVSCIFVSTKIWIFHI